MESYRSCYITSSCCNARIYGNVFMQFSLEPVLLSPISTRKTSLTQWRKNSYSKFSSPSSTFSFFFWTLQFHLTTRSVFIFHCQNKENFPLLLSLPLLPSCLSNERKQLSVGPKSPQALRWGWRVSLETGAPGMSHRQTCAEVKQWTKESVWWHHRLAASVC